MSEQDKLEAGHTLAGAIRQAALLLPCSDLQATLGFFREELGFRLDSISPADDPREALISGHGTRLLLRRGSDAAPTTLRLFCDDEALAARGTQEWVAPNGTRIELVSDRPTLTVPTGRQEFLLTRLSENSAWVTGRAGMRYRDLIPGRLGGRFVASHIEIPEGGKVPDSVHFHPVRFQLIFCVKGWVRLVYQDQGPAFVLEAGDAILQAPGIRHQVLESSAGLGVVEVTCPAEHDTHLDHELSLPSATAHAGLSYGGQGFVRHVASTEPWTQSEVAGWEWQRTAVEEATQGLASVRVLRAAATQGASLEFAHEGELLFLYVLAGELSLTSEALGCTRMAAGDSVTLPADETHVIDRPSEDLRVLEVRL